MTKISVLFGLFGLAHPGRAINRILIRKIIALGDVDNRKGAGVANSRTGAIITNSNNMKRKGLILLLLFGMSLCSNGQEQCKITRKGYLIYFDYSWFFQPCDDSTKTLFQSLDGKTSFRINHGTDGFNNILYDIEDRMALFKTIHAVCYYDRINGELIGDIKYIYCQLSYRKVSFLPNKNIHSCMYALFFDDNKKYGLGCFWFTPELLSFRFR